jgi:hypothetical protein
MTFRTDLLGIAEDIRKDLRGPTGLDQCPNKLQIVQRVWSGGRVGMGTATESVLIDFDRYLPIRYMSAHEVAASGGRYNTQDVMVSRITPSDGGEHGFTPQQLQPVVSQNGIELIYRVTGQIVGDYEILDNRIGGRASHPGGYSGRGGTYSYALILRRRRDS